jgi:uncharacterized tellurite resistance protein B-like protein
MKLLQRFSALFSELASGGKPQADCLQSALEQAAAVLLYEMCRADYDVDDVELERLVASIQETFELSLEEAQQLRDHAEKASEESISLHQYTSLVNDHWGPDTKESLMLEMWRIAYVDGVLDMYEEHQARRLADLLHLPHTRFIRAKLQAKEERERGHGPVRSND